MGKLTLEELNVSIKKGAIDTVILAFPDHLGQLMGKRLTGDFFLENNYANCCDYLLPLILRKIHFPVLSYQDGKKDMETF